MRAMRCVAIAKPEPSSSGRRASASGPGGGKSSASNVPRRRGGGGKAAWGEGAKRAGKRPSDGGATIAAKEKHLYFDEAQIIVVGGQGGEGESWTKGGRAGLEEYSDVEDTSVDENSSSTMYLQLAACVCVVVWASALAAGTFYASTDGRRDDAQEHLRLI